MNDISDRYDTRRSQTDQKIFDATGQLLRHGGPARVTIESVAQESGVAKTSIYRRFSNSDELLEAALQNLAALPDSFPKAVFSRDALPVLQKLAESITQDFGVGMIVGMLTDPGSDTARLLRGSVIRPRIQYLKDMLARAVDAGALRPDTDTEIAVDIILGSAYAQVVRHGRIQSDWAERTYDVIFRAFGN